MKDITVNSFFYVQSSDNLIYFPNCTKVNCYFNYLSNKLFAI